MESIEKDVRVNWASNQPLKWGAGRKVTDVSAQ